MFDCYEDCCKCTSYSLTYIEVGAQITVSPLNTVQEGGISLYSIDAALQVTTIFVTVLKVSLPAAGCVPQYTGH